MNVRSLRHCCHALLVVILLTGCGDARGSVSIVEAEAWSDGSLFLIVPTCDGDPEVTRLEQSETDVGVAVVSGPGSQGECLDSVRADLQRPLGERVLTDLNSGEPVDVADVEGTP